METQEQDILEHQKMIWNRFSSGWRKWDSFIMRFLEPMGKAIIDSLRLKPSDTVLDVATGTGEPGLSIAQITKSGHVTGVDLSEEMLAIAADNARQKGIENYHTEVANVCELPFPDNTFDAVSCRMGFMFFPDMQIAANQIYRVLKPGGRVATSVWGAPSQNFWVTAIMGVLNTYAELPSPGVDTPGIFRCADHDLIKNILATAGFTNISAKEVNGTMDFENADSYWQQMKDVAAPVVAALEQVNDLTRARIKDEVYTALHAKEKSGTLPLEYSAIIFYAEK